MQNNFGKNYKLCSKIQISNLFNRGKRIRTEKLTIIFLADKREFEKPFQVLISVPKKRHKKAVDRNAIKRLCREAVRNNKLVIESYLLNKKRKISFVLNYTGVDLPNYKEIDGQIKCLFEKLITHV